MTMMMTTMKTTMIMVMVMMLTVAMITFFVQKRNSPVHNTEKKGGAGGRTPTSTQSTAHSYISAKHRILKNTAEKRRERRGGEQRQKIKRSMSLFFTLKEDWEK